MSSGALHPPPRGSIYIRGPHRPGMTPLRPGRRDQPCCTSAYRPTPGNLRIFCHLDFRFPDTAAGKVVGAQFRYWRVSGGRNHHAGLNDGHGRTGSWQRADQGACAGVWGMSRTADQQEFSHVFRARGCGVGEGPLCGRLCRGAGSQGLQNTLTYSSPTPEEATGVAKPQPCPVSVHA